jgi:hypothetical protein
MAVGLWSLGSVAVGPEGNEPKNVMVIVKKCFLGKHTTDGRTRLWFNPLIGDPSIVLQCAITPIAIIDKLNRVKVRDECNIYVCPEHLGFFHERLSPVKKQQKLDN